MRIEPTDIFPAGDSMEQVLDGQEKETPADPSPENKPVDTEAAHQPAEKPADDNVPFHKHPRWQELHSKFKAQQSELEGLKRLREELDELKKSSPQKSSTPIPKWFSDLYGEHAERYWPEYSAHESGIRESAVKETLSAIAKQREQEEKAQTDAKRYFDEQFSNLRDEGKEFDENELVDVINRYRPVDPTGQKWDFEKAYSILQLEKAGKGQEAKAKVDAKKKLAAGTMSQGGSEKQGNEVLSIAELRSKGGFRGVARS